MIVIIDNREYHVKFTHVIHPKENSRGKLFKKSFEAPKKSFTECTIMTPEKEIISVGHGVCHPKDNFNKEIGRQKSLKAALLTVFGDKERKLFWDTYRTWGTNGVDRLTGKTLVTDESI